MTIGLSPKVGFELICLDPPASNREHGFFEKTPRIRCRACAQYSHLYIEANPRVGASEVMDRQQLNEKEIFNTARRLNSAEARAEYLQQVCGDNRDFFDRVTAILRGFEEAGNFLECPPSGIAATIEMPPMTEGPNTIIGPYKLLEQIGEGGMGAVFVAVQAPPMERKVALKIIKPGMDSREVLARFEAERQALALMDHPNIAKVLDGGTTAAGRPYFVMELVKGTPITEYCDRDKLTTKARLDLFVSLCHGVQHAHQKGVIHRDLKPGNVLVEVHDVTPVPKIIDFGVAKAIGRHLTEQSLHTGLSQMLGTPLYMSPEQAGQSSLDVDTRSDIYSLGVLLYELLTGHTPFDEETLRTAGPDDLRRIICEVDPPYPSARVSTLQAAELSTISDRRRVESRKLSLQLRGDLDWIVMKALEKDRTRRYETANDLAADVQRYLADEPVQACSPSAWYRFTKFARRNRPALVTSALVALALIAGTGAAVWQAIRATYAEHRATDAEQRIGRALLKAEDRLQFARQTVDEMFVEVAEKWLAQQEGMTPLQKRFLRKALAFYQQLAMEESDNPAIRFEAASAQMRVGEIQGKLEQHSEAEATFRRAVKLLHGLLSEHPDEPRYRRQLAVGQLCLSRLVFASRSQLPEAERELRPALETFQTLAVQFPAEAEYQEKGALCYQELSGSLREAGRSREAEAACRQSLALFQALLASSPKDADRRHNLACAQADLARIVKFDKTAEAETLFHASVSTLTALVADDPKNANYRTNLAAFQNNLGLVLEQRGRLSEAETRFLHAVPLYGALANEFPKTPMYRWQLSKVLGNLAAVMRDSGKADKSKSFELQKHKIIDKLAADYPDVPEYRTLIGTDWTTQACELMEAGKLEEARKLLERAIAKKQSALNCNPDNAEYAQGLAVTLTIMGNVLNRMRRLDEAITVYRSALKIEERIPAKTSSPVREELWRTSGHLAEALEERGEYAEAEVLCRRALEVCNSLVADAPNVPQYRMNLAQTFDFLTRLCGRAKKLSEAEKSGRRAIEIQTVLADERPDDVDVRRKAGAYLSNLAQVLMDAGQLREARTFLEQALVHQRAALKLVPGNEASIRFLITHLKKLTELQIPLGDEGAAARTAAEFAQHVNTFESEHLDSEQLLFRSIDNCETMIAQAEGIHRPDRSVAQRPESVRVAARFLLVKAVIKDALQRSPDNPYHYMIADLLTTAPEPLRDPSLAVKLARRAVQLKPGDPLCMQSLSWALYRTGDFKGVLETLEKQADHNESGFTEAMAYWQLGQKAKAKTIFDRTSEWLKGYERECEERRKQGTEAYPLPSQLGRLQAEARDLINPPPTASPQGSEVKRDPISPPGRARRGRTTESL
jgi:eukaryotic-like serine/threonine-protein kinase